MVMPASWLSTHSPSTLLRPSNNERHSGATLAWLARRSKLSSQRLARLTVDEANQIAESLTDGAMHIVETQGRLELRGAAAGSGVQLFPYLTTRTGIAAAVMEYYR